ncbi:transporter substrate-binding domain-containing protein [Ligilactobacillus sp. WILCCON 0076]|uniref:Transporter substrate-binding domain-containing protein n=1 Tax=Ligilactobacillus ubinensis TaxID=2876789 RepID=A0A9X2FJG2_9LACO|nr:transporter substrate-binding domain-containing protein [Ligilactobacillus ubinensis]MCP0886565.1 transporter substrate-binding domain-containing protein [Ligilactobacillus ubinensis]
MKKSMFKKVIGIIGITMVAGLVLAGCSSKSSDKSVTKIQNKKTLVVGTSADYAPFEFPIVKNGSKQIVGYDMMLAKKIADNLGVKLKIVNTEFPSLISELKNNKVDLVMAGMVSTAQRKKVVAFSKSYYTVYNVMLVQKDKANDFNTISSLANKSIGAQQTTTQESIGKSQLPKSNLVTEASLTSLTTELANGKLSGVIVEKAIADNYVKTYPDKYAIAKVKLTTPKDARQINVAVRKSDKALKNRVNKVITKLKKSGQLDKMFKKAEDLQAKYK